MFYFALVYLISSHVLIDADAQFYGKICRTPLGVEGKCKPLKECGPVYRLTQKKENTAMERQVLERPNCDGSGMVCCPNPCFTPQGRPGECVDINSCPHFVNLLKSPDKPGNLDFARKSRCTGPEERSICCGPSNIPPPSEGSCAASVTAFPPDPTTGCCGKEGKLDNKIVGGNETTIDQYPWLVVIEYVKLEARKLLCGGSLISGKYVLTAAHCVVGDVLEYGTPKFVRLGEYDTGNDGPDCVKVEGLDACTYGAYKVDIEKIIPHPEYRPASSRNNDIAMIRLKEMAPFSAFIRPICLPQADYTVTTPPKFDLFVSGWGRYLQRWDGRDWVGIASRIKLYIQVPYVDLKSCQSAFSSTTIWKGQICAGGQDGKDSCRGDSGGPLMYSNNNIYEAIGVVSFGPKMCGQTGIPGVYTNVYNYLPWIKENIKE